MVYSQSLLAIWPDLVIFAPRDCYDVKLTPSLPLASFPTPLFSFFILCISHLFWHVWLSLMVVFFAIMSTGNRVMFVVY